MSSLFIRIYLSTLVFLAFAFFLLVFITNSLIPSEQMFDNSRAIEATVTQYLKNKPEKNWGEEIKIFDRVLLDQNLSIITSDELTKAESERLKLSTTGRIKSDVRVDSYYILYQIPDSNSLIKILDTIQFTDTTLNDWLDVVLPVFLLFSTLAFGLFLLIRKLTKPIEHLTTVAKKLGRGELNVRAKSNLPKPMNTLAMGFNNMADQINETMQEQQLLIGAIPHELRSPLGRIRFALDLTRNKNTVVELREHIEKIDTYVDDMQQTVDEILELNRMQSKNVIEADSIELCELIDSLRQSFQTTITGINLSVHCELPQNPSGSASLIKHAIQNILENATRYAKSEITLAVWYEGGQTIIQVDDDGAGIPEDKLHEVFMPFATTDDSRNRTTGGIGLGLALVKNIMIKHGGNVTASQSTQGGARFKLYW